MKITGQREILFLAVSVSRSILRRNDCEVLVTRLRIIAIVMLRIQRRSEILSIRQLIVRNAVAIRLFQVFKSLSRPLHLTNNTLSLPMPKVRYAPTQEMRWRFLQAQFTPTPTFPNLRYRQYRVGTNKPEPASEIRFQGNAAVQFELEVH